jgi:hypothetical protein
MNSSTRFIDLPLMKNPSSLGFSLMDFIQESMMVAKNMPK